MGLSAYFPIFLKQKALPKTLIPLVGEDRIMGNKRFAGAWKEGKRYYRYMYGLLARRRRKIFAILQSRNAIFLKEITISEAKMLKFSACGGRNFVPNRSFLD